MEKVVRKLRLLKNDPAGLLIIDQELAQRAYVPPVQNA
ncbi:putative ferritin-like protein [[Clostridium] sordellii ATCC 9714]|nr:putative ferritin-like protein [[Clostridium] sordellii ATCC 9714] [Paeniclostridium sordellii ATCC 9714]